MTRSPRRGSVRRHGPTSGPACSARAPRWTRSAPRSPRSRPADTSDGEGSIFETYDTRFVHRWLKDTYAEFATTSPQEFPTLAQLFREGGPFRALATQFMNEFDYNPGHEDDGEGDGTGTSDGTSGASGAGLAAYAASADPDETKDAFEQLRNFHAPFSKNPREKPAIDEVRFDVQQVLAVLGEYPAIARQLGLVHDLEVAHPGNLGDTTVQVLATWPSLVPAERDGHRPRRGRIAAPRDSLPRREREVPCAAARGRAGARGRR